MRGYVKGLVLNELIPLSEIGRQRDDLSSATCPVLFPGEDMGAVQWPATLKAGCSGLLLNVATVRIRDCTILDLIRHG